MLGRAGLAARLTDALSRAHPERQQSQQLLSAAALGDAGLTLSAGTGGDQLGAAVAGIGDVNADGLADVALGAPRDASGGADAGAVRVVFGRKAGGTIALDDPAAGYRLVGRPDSLAGLSVAGLPDIDGDGRPEVIVGAPAKPADAQLPGSAAIVYGRPTGADVQLGALGAAGIELRGTPGDLFGLTVSSVGDLNGDGRNDLGVGAPRADIGPSKNAGRALLLFTPAPGSGTIDLKDGPTAAQGLTLDGANPGELTGTAVEPIGDIDGDGKLDVAIAAPFSTAFGRRESGAAYVIGAQKLADPGAKEPVRVSVAGLGAAGFRLGGAQEQGFIRFAGAGGDLDGDGAPDLVVGAIAVEDGNDPPQRAGAAYVLFGPKPVPPPPPLPPDPGVQEEVAAGCRASELTEFIVDDSGSMSYNDSANLRERAIEALLAKPRSIGKSLGGVEFGDLSNELFPPQVVREEGRSPEQGAALRKVLRTSIVADNGSTDYNAGFVAARSAAPKADARVFLTDGEHNVEEYANLHRGGPPTYVIGLTIGREGEAAERLARIAKETEGRYYPNVKAETLQPVINAIDSRLNCDVDLRSFVDELTDGDTGEPNDVPLDEDTNSVDVQVSWDDPAAVLTPGDIELRTQGGRRLARVSARTQRLALQRVGRSLPAGNGLRVSGRRGPTFYTLRVTGVQGAELRVRTAAREREGRRVTRAHTQVAQSRRRR